MLSYSEADEEFAAKYADHELLCSAEIIDLLKRSAAGDAAARSRVIAHHARLVLKVARQPKFARIPHTAGAPETIDLVHEGFIGLCYAVDRCKPASRRTFSSYAYTCIEGHIKTAISANLQSVHYSNQINNDYRKLTGAVDVTRGQSPHDFSVSELMLRTGLSRSRVEIALNIPLSTLSLDMEISQSGDQHLTFGEIVPDPRQQSDNFGIESYTTQEQLDLLYMRYVDKLTARQIARELGRSPQDVARALQDAMRALNDKPGQAVPTEHSIADSLDVRIACAFVGLSIRHQLTLFLHYVQGHGAAAVADVCGIDTSKAARWIEQNTRALIEAVGSKDELDSIRIKRALRAHHGVRNDALSKLDPTDRRLASMRLREASSVDDVAGVLAVHRTTAGDRELAARRKLTAIELQTLNQIDHSLTAAA